ncbi:MAG: hypothetical protein HY200_00740 [Nitrospirae bacterium]|nr:hypothetical protein [Nitrospirota bacterium]
MENKNGEMKLIDFWNIIIKRKNIVICLSLFSIALTFSISLYFPKIYEGEVVLAIPTGYSGYVINTSESQAIINVLLNEIKKGNPFGGIDANLVKSIDNIKLSPISNSESKLTLLVYVKQDPNKGYEVLNKIVSYLQGNEYVANKINYEKEALQENIGEAKKELDDVLNIKNGLQKLIVKKSSINISPIELESKINELKSKIRNLEVERLSIRGYEYVTKPYVYKNKVKPNLTLNAILAGIFGLFLSILLVLALNSFEIESRGKE